LQRTSAEKQNNPSTHGSSFRTESSGIDFALKYSKKTMAGGFEKGTYFLTLFAGFGGGVHIAFLFCVTTGPVPVTTFESVTFLRRSMRVG
jgi:hypothetical protein